MHNIEGSPMYIDVLNSYMNEGSPILRVLHSRHADAFACALQRVVGRQDGVQR